MHAEAPERTAATTATKPANSPTLAQDAALARAARKARALAGCPTCQRRAGAGEAVKPAKDVPP